MLVNFSRSLRICCFIRIHIILQYYIFACVYIIFLFERVSSLYYNNIHNMLYHTYVYVWIRVHINIYKHTRTHDSRVHIYVFIFISTHISKKHITSILHRRRYTERARTNTRTPTVTHGQSCRYTTGAHWVGGGGKWLSNTIPSFSAEDKRRRKKKWTKK